MELQYNFFNVLRGNCQPRVLHTAKVISDEKRCFQAHEEIFLLGKPQIKEFLKNILQGERGGGSREGICI